MALAVHQLGDLTGSVAQAVIDNYPSGHTRLIDWQTPEGSVPTLLVESADRAEMIVPRSIPLAALGPALTTGELPAEVWVLVAADRMGAAHRTLRGTGVWLQPWWGNERIQFGRPERT